MQLSKIVFAFLPIAALALIPAGDASACGGCFHIQQTESTQVTGHRMILSVSKNESTLWDQISYVGDPKSFAWVLPIKGQVEVGISSDAVFSALDSGTQAFISSPSIDCAPPPSCGNGYTSGLAVAAAGGGVSDGLPPVTVISQEVVGPYETVQLSATDPQALQNWLDQHGFVIPQDISPIISTYVSEGFGFLALKLVPGQGIHAMKPVRVTTPGASPVLPLRMVAAGTGMTVPITLWVIAEGKYTPMNFPSFTIPEDKLVWDWDKQKSNYTDLQQAGFAETAGKGWLLEASITRAPSELFGQLLDLALYNPEESGYTDEMGSDALLACSADLAALTGSVSPDAVVVTRLHAELPRAALTTDLTLGADANQEMLVPYYSITKTVGKAPSCPTYPPPQCDGDNGTNGTNGTDKAFGEGCTCTVGSATDASAMLGGALFTFGWVLARRRRSPRSASRR